MWWLFVGVIVVSWFAPIAWGQDPDEVAKRLDRIAQQLSAYRDIKTADAYKQKAVDGDPCAMYLLSRLYVYGLLPQYPAVEGVLKRSDWQWAAAYDRPGKVLDPLGPIPNSDPAKFWLEQAANADFFPALISAQIAEGGRLMPWFELRDDSPLYKAALFGSGQALAALAIQLFRGPDNQSSDATIPLENDPDLLEFLHAQDEGGRSDARAIGFSVLLYLAKTAKYQPSDVVDKYASDWHYWLRDCDEKDTACPEGTANIATLYESAYRRAAKSPPDFSCPGYQVRGSMSEDQVLELLQAHSSNAASLIRVNGVNFELTPALERKFVAAGADQSVLEAIRASQPSQAK